MKKTYLAFACVVPLIAASVASAQSVTLYFGSQGQAPTCAATHPLANPTLYLAPQGQCNALLVPFGTRPTYDVGSLDIWMNVGANGGGACGVNTLSSLGLDIRKANVIDATWGGTGTNVMSAPAPGLFVSNTILYTGAAAIPWSSPSPNTPTYPAATTGSDVVDDSRAVAVPAGHVALPEPLWNGYCPGGPYHVGELKLQSGTQALTTVVPTTKYELRMAVGNVKITRVYDPAAAQGAATETVQFGAGDGTTNGSAVGASSATADATVIIRKKGDFGKNVANVNVSVPDGIVDNGTDFSLFLNLGVGATCGTLDNWLGDFGRNVANVNVANPDGICDNGTDFNMFLLAVGS